MKRLASSRFGFTLIEVLVVIAIIGILVTIVSASFSEAREQSRDKIRMADLKQLQLALESYKAQYGRYPAMGCSVPTSPGGVGGVWVGPPPMSGSPNSWGGWGCDEYITGLVPEFLPELPKDPIFDDDVDAGYIYSTDANGTGYKVLANPETIKVYSYDHEFARCPRPGSSCEGMGHCEPEDLEGVYAIYSDGAECR
jgi:prepilin-type N-terminal cleavage/methylation domain-containing protein